jgi:hypothetical protein
MDVNPVVINGNKKREYDPSTDCIPATEHCGRYYTPLGEIYLIKENLQSVNFGGLDVDGVIHLEGQLILEE